MQLILCVQSTIKGIYGSNLRSHESQFNPVSRAFYFKPHATAIRRYPAFCESTFLCARVGRSAALSSPLIELNFALALIAPTGIARVRKTTIQRVDFIIREFAFFILLSFFYRSS